MYGIVLYCICDVLISRYIIFYLIFCNKEGGASFNHFSNFTVIILQSDIPRSIVLINLNRINGYKNLFSINLFTDWITCSCCIMGEKTDCLHTFIKATVIIGYYSVWLMAYCCDSGLWIQSWPWKSYKLLLKSSHSSSVSKVAGSRLDELFHSQLHHVETGSGTHPHCCQWVLAWVKWPKCELTSTNV